MGNYNIGEVWWIHFPYEDSAGMKRRPAIIIDDDTIAILAMYVTRPGVHDNSRDEIKVLGISAGSLSLQSGMTI